MIDKNLTLFLVLKDRPYYTYRLMKYMDWLKYPFKIIIADGGKNKEIQQVLEENKNFPNLDYTYVRCPYDGTLDDFHEKMGDTIKLVDTPIVSVIDNDDFFLLEGYFNCLNLLKENPTYTSARGALNVISIAYDVWGQSHIGENIYSTYKNSVVGDTAADRMTFQTKNFHSNWHNLTRTNHVKACWAMLNVIKPQNMRFTEQVTGYLNVLWGTGYRGDFPWGLHQHGQRIETGGNSLESHFPSQKEWISSETWLGEFNKMTELMGVAIAEYDDIPVEEAMNKFVDTYPFKVGELEKDFRIRTQEARSLGYNEERIKELFKVIKQHNIKELPQVGEIVFSPLTSHEEMVLLDKFLQSQGNVNA